WLGGFDMVPFSHSGRKAFIGTLYFMLVLLLFFASPLLLAQDLNPEQQQKLAAVQSGLKRVDTNFQLASQSAGTGVPTGSMAKLSKMRLDSAAVDLPQIKQLLSELPTGNADVQQAAAQYAAIEQAIRELDDRIAGKNVPAAAAPAAAAQPAPQPAAPATAPATTPATAPATAPAATPAAAPPA